MTNPVTEIQAELFDVDQLDVKCPDCGEHYLQRDKKTVSTDGTYSIFEMVCPAAECSGQAVLKVPRSEEAQRGVATELQIGETELEPDDGFSIAQLDVLLTSEGPSLVRESKEVDEVIAQTTYSYRPDPEDGMEVQVVVPHE